jgi:hypothetical protein
MLQFSIFIKILCLIQSFSRDKYLYQFPGRLGLFNQICLVKICFLYFGFSSEVFCLESIFRTNLQIPIPFLTDLIIKFERKRYSEINQPAW